MDSWDLDDYERRQAELEFVGLDEDWIEQQLGERGSERDSIDFQDSASPSRPQLVPLTLRFAAVCQACRKPLAEGDSAVAQRFEGRWLTWHPGHETLPPHAKALPVAKFEPGERTFEVRFSQPCTVCGTLIAVGDTAAGTKLDRGWTVRHPTCDRA